MATAVVVVVVVRAEIDHGRLSLLALAVEMLKCHLKSIVLL